MPATEHNRRVHERFDLPAMYTTVIACCHGSGGDRRLHGHVYDISQGGARIELDEPLAPGERVTVDLELPGSGDAMIAVGRVVWVNDDADDPGPRRMAVRFDGFGAKADRDRLGSYLSDLARRAA